MHLNIPHRSLSLFFILALLAVAPIAATPGTAVAAKHAAASQKPRFTKDHRYVVPPDAPDWYSTTFKGVPISMRSLRGSIVVLDFWGTWCPSCIAWLPHMIRLEKKYGSEGVQFMTVNVEPGTTPKRHRDVVRDFMEQHKYDFPVIVDSDSTVMRAHDIQVFPTVMVVDANGRIRYASSGSSRETETSLVALLDDLVKPKAGHASSGSKASVRSSAAADGR